MIGREDYKLVDGQRSSNVLTTKESPKIFQTLGHTLKYWEKRKDHFLYCGVFRIPQVSKFFAVYFVAEQTI